MLKELLISVKAIVENFRRFCSEGVVIDVDVEDEELAKSFTAGDRVSVEKMEDEGVEPEFDDEKNLKLKEYNPYKDKHGHTASKKAGNLYSLTRAGAKKVGSDEDKAKRGVYTSKGKVRAKFGTNSSKPDVSCGRKTIDGKDINPKKYCDDRYPKKYKREGIEEETSDEDAQKEAEKKKRASTRKVATALRNKNKNKNDGVPRGIDSKSRRLDKLGYPKELQALAHGIVAYENKGAVHEEEEAQINGLSHSDSIYLKTMVRRELWNVLQAWSKQRGSCSFQQILQGIEAINIAENPPKEKK